MRPTTVSIGRTTITSAALAALVFFSAFPARAQGTPASHWIAWTGCWSAMSASTSPEFQPRTVCVTPTASSDVAEVTAIADGKLVSRDRIDASGQPHAIDDHGCAGSERAHWSYDHRRVFLESAVTCDGLLSRMSAVLAMTPGGEWLDIRRITAGEGENVRVARYREVAAPAALPAELASALASRSAYAGSARLATGARIGNDAIVEATRAVGPEVVEAWLRESGQRFDVDARSLTQLADAGVPARVTDAMIAVSAPASHQVYYYDEYRARYGGFGNDGWDAGTGARVIVRVYDNYDPWGYPYWRYGYGRFYTRYIYPSAFAWTGYGPAFYGVSLGRAGVPYLYPPVLVLHQNGGGTESRGRAEAGHGYGRGSDRDAHDDPRPTTRTAQPRAEPPRPPANERASSGSHEESGSSRSSGRWAKSRP